MHCVIAGNIANTHKTRTSTIVMAHASVHRKLFLNKNPSKENSRALANGRITKTTHPPIPHVDNVVVLKPDRNHVLRIRRERDAGYSKLVSVKRSKLAPFRGGEYTNAR